MLVTTKELTTVSSPAKSPQYTMTIPAGTRCVRKGNGIVVADITKVIGGNAHDLQHYHIWVYESEVEETATASFSSPPTKFPQQQFKNLLPRHGMHIMRLWLCSVVGLDVLDRGLHGHRCKAAQSAYSGSQEAQDDQAGGRGRIDAQEQPQAGQAGEKGDPTMTNAGTPDHRHGRPDHDYITDYV